MRAMIVGDTHGNTDWLRKYIFPVAMSVKADAVIVLGDFGAWEHTPGGIVFMNDCSELATRAAIPLYWLHGNHDKFSHTLAAYGANRTQRGFVACRDGVYYIPQGLSWTWSGITFRSFGGAYSVDKSWRIAAEKQRHAAMVAQARRRAAQNPMFTDEVPSQAGSLWFPEEEMTDAEMEQLLLDDYEIKDVILSHDKPLSAKPDWDRKDYPACVPNQLRLERALRVHQPAVWLHGHLHYHYHTRVHGDGWSTDVIGLDPDNSAAETGRWRRENTWALLEVGGPKMDLRIGSAVTLETGALGAARDTLMAKVRT